MDDLMTMMEKAENPDEFLAFIAFCLERIDRDEQVRAIWLDWIRSTDRRCFESPMR